jgi:anti-sigma regulatory factor (Ser/Thr protein kinase)
MSDKPNATIRAAMEEARAIDEPDVVQIQMDIQSAVDEAVRNIREHALRQVMAIVNRIGSYDDKYQHMCQLIYDEIEAMIAEDIASDATDGGRFAKIADANDTQ